MTILDLKRKFKQELNALYSEQEGAQLFQIFAKEIIGFDSYHLRRFQNQQVLLQDLEEFNQVIEKLLTGTPYQQVLGFTEFYGYRFEVNSHVLIPRPETEELIELALAELDDHPNLPQNSSLLDIGTGSGIIPIVIKRKRPLLNALGIDISLEALEIAQKNAKKLEVDVEFSQLDILCQEPPKSFEIIISNPPYIGIDEENDILDSVKKFEPHKALFSPTSDPLLFYRRIAELCGTYLKPGGLLILEINQKLGVETRDLYSDVLKNVKLLQDLSGNDRFVIGTK